MQSQTFDRRAFPSGAALSRWAAPDGWSYRRMDWPKRGKARGSLLFAGGRGDFIEKYLEACAWWHGQGWNVTSFDWRGQGDSRGSDGKAGPDDLDLMVEDLAALIEQWRASSPGTHVAVAHSMGGHLLLRTLAERGPEIDAAVLVAPMLMINSAPLPSAAAWGLSSFLSMFGMGSQPVWQQGRRPAPVGTSRQTILTASPERYEDELYWWKKHPGYNLGVPSWGWLDRAYRSCAALTPERLAQVKLPVLLVGSERDRLVSPAAIRRASTLLPDAELLMFDDSGHEILREADPVRLAALERIDSFLEARLGR
jgi:lysophospholipase